MTSARDDADLTQVGPGPLMGNLMRQYWIPACLSSELEPGTQPVRLLPLGEQLVAFRDKRRRVDRPEVFRNACSGAFLAPEGQDWYEAYLEHLETIVGPLQPARAAE